jgi:regulator of cell morphogenesis and NO signaling
MTVAISAADPIGQIAARHPHLVPLFETLGLDYCCHGRLSLLEACERAGVDPQRVLGAPPPVGTPDDPDPDWTAMSISALCDDIEAHHHAPARAAFTALDTLLPRIVAAHGDHHPELIPLAAAVAALRHNMMDHMVREERVLFPWLRRLERPSSVHIGPPWSVRRPIDCMEHDHEDVAAALDRIRTLTDGYRIPPDACTSYRAMLDLLQGLERDTRVHIHKENNILFPAGIRAETARAEARERYKEWVHPA